MHIFSRTYTNAIQNKSNYYIQRKGLEWKWLKLTKLTLPVLVGPLSAIQPHFDTNLSWSLGYIRKLKFKYHWGKLFHSRYCVQPTHGAQEYHSCKYTAHSGYQFTPWLSGASEIHFCAQEIFMLGQCRIWTRDLSICIRTGYHRTNAPRNVKKFSFTNILFSYKKKRKEAIIFIAF